MKKLHLLGMAIALIGCIEHELPIPAREPGVEVIRYADLGSDYNAQLHVQLHTGEVVASHPKEAWCTRFHQGSETRRLASAPTARLARRNTTIQATATTL